MRADLQRLKRDTESGRAVTGAALGGSLGESQDTPRQIASGSVPVSGAVPQPRPKRWWVGLVASAIALVAIALLTFRLTVPLPPLKVSGYVQLTNDGRAKLWPGVLWHLVTDGSRLYYVESPFVSPMLMQVSTLGGETSAIPTPFLVNQIGDISPDRSSLLIPAYAAQRTRRHSGYCPFPRGRPAAWGNCLAMTEPGLRMDSEYSLPMAMTYTSPRTDGTESKKFASVPGFSHWPRWSPDGSRLRISVCRPKDRIIFVVGNPGRRKSSSSFAARLEQSSPGMLRSWTPDGKYFIFQSDHDGKTQIWAIPEKGGLFRKARWEPTELTTGPLSYSRPGPSVDGKRLFAIGSQPRGELGRFNQKTQQFEPYLSGISAEGCGLLQGWAMGDLRLVSRR